MRKRSQKRSSRGLNSLPPFADLCFFRHRSDYLASALGSFAVKLSTNRTFISGHYGFISFIWRQLGVLEFFVWRRMRFQWCVWCYVAASAMSIALTRVLMRRDLFTLSTGRTRRMLPSLALVQYPTVNGATTESDCASISTQWCDKCNLGNCEPKEEPNISQGSVATS